MSLLVVFSSGLPTLAFSYFCWCFASLFLRKPQQTLSLQVPLLCMKTSKQCGNVQDIESWSGVYLSDRLLESPAASRNSETPTLSDGWQKCLKTWTVKPTFPFHVFPLQCQMSLRIIKSHGNSEIRKLAGFFFGEETFDFWKSFNSRFFDSLLSLRRRHDEKVGLTADRGRCENQRSLWKLSTNPKASGAFRPLEAFIYTACCL